MDRHGRKQSVGRESEEMPWVQAAKEEIMPGYEEYLVLLQERNRLLKRLRKKDKGQIEQERKEQGFSLYVNGPHKNARPSGKSPGKQPTIPTQPQPKTARKPKTAGESRNPNILDNQALAELAKEEMERQRKIARAKTAPNVREKRKNWNVESSLEIKTTRGGTKIKAPDLLTGKYADDFESGEESDEVRSSGSENTEVAVRRQQHRKPLRKPPPPRESDLFNSSDSVCSEDEEVQMSRNMSAVLEGDSEDEMEIDASNGDYSRGRNQGRSPEPDSDSEEEEEGHGEKLMLSMRELRTLRQSLVKNATIRQSMARDNSYNTDDYVPESPIPEVEEDVPTDESENFEESPRRNINLKQPNDTIVLEFGGGPPPSKKVERNLSAARRRDLDNGEYSSRPGSGRSKPGYETKPANRPHSTKTLVADNKKSSRPLSANRRTPVTNSTDPDGEASAVMAALRAENEKASKLKQTPKQKPSPRPAKNNSSRPIVDRSEPPPRAPRRSESPRASVGSSATDPLVPMDKIGQIMERVLRMSPTHQRRLVNMLGKLEKTVVADSQDKPALKSRNKQPSMDGPLRAVHSSSNKSSFMSGCSVASDENTLPVHIEVKSNWGHAMRLGLTEIQVYDQHGNLVHVSGDDVSVHGAEECRGTVDVLFNGKFKSNKERNMWSCRYHARRPVEFIMNVRNPRPGERFNISQIKIWNFNTSIKELDIGIKDVRVFVGSDLVYCGAVEKGCGNQVFDYGHVIAIPDNTCDSNPQVPVEKPDSPEVPVNAGKRPVKSAEKPARSPDVPVKSVRNESVKTPKKIENHTTPVRTSADKRQKRREANELKSKQNVQASQSRDSVVQSSSSKESLVQISKSRDSVESSISKSQRRPPLSPRGERSPSPAPRFPAAKSPREVTSVNHRTISPRRSQDRKKTFRSISMSSQSSAESGGESQPNSRPASGVMTPTERQVRSETRTIYHSDSETEDSSNGPIKSSQPPGKMRGTKTPRKSKRMGARLGGHSSAEVDSSRSVSDSVESRPPIPHRKSEEKNSRKSMVEKALERPAAPAISVATEPVVMDTGKRESEGELDDTLKGSTTISSSVSVASSQDDMPMLQKLKDMNKKEQTSSRKKDVPRWLKQEDIAKSFESPTESVEMRAKKPAEVRTQRPGPPPTQKEINMLIDEEMSQFPENKKGAVQPEPAGDKPDGSTTPMQRIEKNRSKWREGPGLNLEESWGSLSQFNKCQRGRLSLDMDDDVLDEYINKAAKLAGLPSEPAIPEEASQTPLTQMVVDSDDEDFVIPELPYGRELVINIRSTWGDKHYVGFTGIEVFSATGEQANIIKVFADPSDINMLPEYNKDPRVVGNLIDGTNRTRDDIHMWLAPFTQGQDHWVYCTLDKPCKIALIRIWNYNKSRIHSYRGVKDVIMALDSTVIFRGEIARACGGIEGGTEAFGDTILFTTDESILDLVSQHDAAYEGEMLDDDEPFDVERPSTADAGDEKGRPLTRAVGNIKQMERELTVFEYEGNMMAYRGHSIELNFTATWGDMHYVGLTGVEVVGKDGEALPITMEMLTANPPDLHHLPGHELDDRTLDKVIDGTNVTTSDEHMWLVPFVEGENHTLTIDFDQKVLVAGLRVWNYNKSKEDTYRGVRIVHVAIDGKPVSPPEGFLVRKGPGNCHFDFAQELSFSPQSWNTGGMLSALGPSPSNADDDYEVVQMPCGFIYQLQLFSTWGDAYYVGLNGIELYDGSLKMINLTENNISAFPGSVNMLEKMQNDVRTPEKLIDGVNDTTDGGHMWLAPILPNILNRVYVIFDQPTTISMIKIWNYSKTASRGAKDFALLVDDLLVYNGTLQGVPTGARGILPTCDAPQPYHTILFTNNKDILRKEKHTVINQQTDEQDVQMTNEKKIVSHYTDPKKAQSGKPVDQKMRPKTSVIHSKKR
ncbi:katanin-interacting protein-like isoform X2 [Mya arenaria]|uniref:katanin-interacting protein-like isoform X2 n=1 Tax=Mya arenaria TaxID=6604 RepID=UPI0022E57139|nr:katanin-interacting protein-like isoform X2 [Mya arenaria]